jgi:hypothetical protein
MVCIIKPTYYSNYKDTPMQKIKTILEYVLLGIVTVVVTVYIYSFFPTVEDVKYADQKEDRFRNYLEITVNSKATLKSLLSFKRDQYIFYFATKGKTYTEKNILEISVNGTKEMKIKPEQALVKIEDNQPGNITVNVDIKDERIPNLINGTYRLKAAESTPAYVSYKLQ